MKHVKSERLKKLEAELEDLEQWLKLGLVPKRDLEKHSEEIQELTSRIEEEKERLRFLKENGDSEEYIAPKKSQGRSLSDMPSIPDLDADSIHGSDANFDQESSSHSFEQTLTDKDEASQGPQDSEALDDDFEEEESYFSDKNRWRRGGIVDPDADDW